MKNPQGKKKKSRRVPAVKLLKKKSETLKSMAQKSMAQKSMAQKSMAQKSTAKKSVAKKSSAKGRLSPIERSLIEQSVEGALQTELSALETVLNKTPPVDPASVEAMLEGASPDDAKRLQALLKGKKADGVKRRTSDELSDDWRRGGYPYKHRMFRKEYEEEKFVLQSELLKLQIWMKEARQRLVLLFEGRDAAGKGGAIKRFMEHLNPRGARVVALEKPSEVERGQWYFQRYVEHLPTAGEIVLFDRSWYNRAGVERVMSFCTQEEYDEFLRQVPEFERNLVRSGIHLIKLWFSVSRAEQRRRFKEREAHLKQWKLANRSRIARQVGRLHPRQGSDVLPHRYRGSSGPSSSPTTRSGRGSMPCAMPTLCPTRERI